jgi:hypothetical protein
VEAGFEERRRRAEVKADNVLKELVKVAFVDLPNIGVLFDQAGNLRPIETLSEAEQAIIASVELVTDIVHKSESLGGATVEGEGARAADAALADARYRAGAGAAGGPGVCAPAGYSRRVRALNSSNPRHGFGRGRCDGAGSY